jgi:thiol-disulfide isomerase/thioredoxin
LGFTSITAASLTVAIFLSATGISINYAYAQSFSEKTSRSIALGAQAQLRSPAPELKGGRGWLNTAKPLSLAALKGKIVLLDFWTYGCINCIHIIPHLKQLEQKYANQLVILGIHSGRYENERETENIRRIILRYDVEHPVYNDADFTVLDAYKVKSWPTRVLIDPAGNIVGRAEGEGNYEQFDRVIGRIAADYRQRGELNEEPLKLALERASVGDLPLAFPGKVLADAKSDRLFIADSTHNRIVITQLDGTLVATIGSGESGATDGSFAKASFFRPQGMAWDGKSLYVADTANHLIRRVDLQSKTVETIAGTGSQGVEVLKVGSARTVALSSPWDLQLIGRALYIAMSGLQQIWKLDLDKNEVATFAGSGREGTLDAPLLEARFGQPSGITSDGKMLYTADAEGNVVRAIDTEKGEVRTLVGSPRFEFGDKDGQGGEARLQHPLSVLALNDQILIADTYNHKIKELDPKKRTVKTLLGTGKPGQRDGNAPSFYEPAGLSVAKGKLYVADTNNHAIRVVDLKTKATSTLNIKGLEPPAAIAPIASTDNIRPNLEEIRLAKQRLRVRPAASLVINVEMPAGYHLNPAAPQRYQVSLESGAAVLALDEQAVKGTIRGLQLPLRMPLGVIGQGSAELRIQLTLYYCREDNTGTCRIRTLVFRAPVEVTDASDAAQEVEVHGRLDEK